MDSFSSEDLEALLPQPMARRVGGPTTARLAARAPPAPASMISNQLVKPAAAPATNAPVASLGGGMSSESPVRVPAAAAMSAGLAAARAAAESPGRSLGASSSGHELLEESLGESINLETLLP